MILWLSIWGAGVVATLHRYYDTGRDRYRPTTSINVRKPYRMLFRDWACIAVAWPFVLVWAAFTHIKRNW